MDSTGFQTYLAGINDEIQGLIQELDTWAGNKFDANAAFNYNVAKVIIDSAVASFQTSVASVTAE